MKKRGQNRHKYLFAMASLCAAISMIFNAVTIKNILACHDIMARTEALSERAAGLKDRNLAQKKKEPFVSESEMVSVQTRETAAEIISPKDIQDIRENVERETKLMSEQEEAEMSSGSLDLQQIFYNTADIGGQWALSVMDLREGRVYGWNEEVTMQSASVIKVFIMAAVYGRICYPADEASVIYAPEQYEGELKDLLTNMITVSDNASANRLVELLGYGDFQVGKDVVNSFCQSNGYSGTHLGRRFMEENPQDDNYTTAADCRKVLSDIYNGTCVCEEASRKMLALLQGQTVKTKISAGLPGSVLSANKTGEMPEGYGLGCIENDIAIVYGEQRDYILCVLANNLDGRNEEARARIGDISRQIYEVLQ